MSIKTTSYKIYGSFEKWHLIYEMILNITKNQWSFEDHKSNFVISGVLTPKKLSNLKYTSSSVHDYCYLQTKIRLEQLECLRSEIPPAAPWLPILVIHIRSQVKTTQSQSYKFKKNAKTSNYEIWHNTLHTTHLLKLLDKMYKYEMDPTRTVEAPEGTWDAGRTRDGQTDGQTDGRSETNIPPNNFVVRV